MNYKEFKNQILQLQNNFANCINTVYGVKGVRGELKGIPLEVMKEYADTYGETLQPITKEGYVMMYITQILPNGSSTIEVVSKKQVIMIQEAV